MKIVSKCSASGTLLFVAGLHSGAYMKAGLGQTCVEHLGQYHLSVPRCSVLDSPRAAVTEAPARTMR